MEKIINLEMKIPKQDISKVTLNEKSRSEMFKILKELQQIYVDKKTKSTIFDYLKNLFPESENDLWRIFVLALVKQGRANDLDELFDLTNNHMELREIMGHKIEDDSMYEFDSLKRSMDLFTPKVFNEINEIIVNAGYRLVINKRLQRLKKR